MPGPIPTPQRSQGLAGSRLRRKPIYLLTQDYLDSSPQVGAAAADLGGGTGTWVNPANAVSDNATYAVWTR